jgi:hypothetical protein
MSANRKFRIDRVRRVGEVSCIGRNLRAWIDQERLHATLVTPSRSIPPHGKGHTVLSYRYLRAVDRFHTHVSFTHYTKASSGRACGAKSGAEGGGSEQCLGNQLRGSKRGSSDGKNELSVKNACQAYCFSTLNHTLSFCYNDRRVLKWVGRQALRGFQGLTGSFD